MEDKPQVGNGRDEKGRLLPGFTANKEGRPKKKRFEDYYSEEEKESLINKIKTSENEGNWMKEAEMIFGKAKQPFVGGDEDDEPIKITGINYILPDGNNSKTRPEAAPSIPIPEQSKD